MFRTPLSRERARWVMFEAAYRVGFRPGYVSFSFIGDSDLVICDLRPEAGLPPRGPGDFERIQWRECELRADSVEGAVKALGERADRVRWVLLEDQTGFFSVSIATYDEWIRDGVVALSFSEEWMVTKSMPVEFTDEEPPPEIKAKMRRLPQGVLRTFVKDLGAYFAFWSFVNGDVFLFSEDGYDKDVDRIVEKLLQGDEAGALRGLIGLKAEDRSLGMWQFACADVAGIEAWLERVASSEVNMLERGEGYIICEYTEIFPLELE